MLATNKLRSIPRLVPGGGLATATCAVLPVHMGRVGQATAQAAGDTWEHVASCFDSCGQLQFKLTNAACGEWSRIRSLSDRAGNEPSEDLSKFHNYST